METGMEDLNIKLGFQSQLNNSVTATKEMT